MSCHNSNLEIALVLLISRELRDQDVQLKQLNQIQIYLSHKWSVNLAQILRKKENNLQVDKIEETNSQGEVYLS